jgi:DNA-binding CsgD family transcriptional regulator
LSDRGLQELRLLDSERSGPEIARELLVSHNMVRTQTKHTFTKLDVTDRRAEVRRPRQRLVVTSPALRISPSQSHRWVTRAHPTHP